MSEEGPGRRLLRAAVLTAALTAVVYGVVTIDPGIGGPGDGRLASGCTAAAALGWLGLVAGRPVRSRPALLGAALALLVVAGGVLTALRPNGPAFAFCAVGVFAAAAIPAVPPRWAAALAGAGIAGLVGTALAVGLGPGGTLGTAAGLVAVTMGGFNRRQFRERLAQAEQLAAQTVRTQQERARAAALAERARIAREIHDVLAHSLGALAVQLDAADALLTEGHDPQRARGHVVRARGLAVDGLTETRRAIGALRGDPLPLPDLVAALADAAGAALRTGGTPRDLAPDVALAAYRATQEAVSNARKHAPGAPVTIELDYRHDELVLTVSDQPGPGTATTPLAGTGGGYGLTGLRERAELLGGTLTAGPDGAGWTVRLRLPAPAGARP